MNLKNKLILIGTGQMLVLALVLVAVSYHNARQKMLDAEVQKARAVVLTTESMREEMADKWRQGVITTAQLQEWARKGEMEKVVGSVPVVSAWRAAMSKAREGGYEFRVPKFQPRNPDHQPDVLESKVLRKFEAENITEYYEIDEQRNALRFFRPIRLTQECMLCHGDPRTSAQLWGNDQGEDPTGVKMENWKVGEVHGAFEIVQSLDAADQQARDELLNELAVFVVVLGAGIGFFLFFLNRGLSKPLSHLMAGVESMAHGDDSVRIDIHSADELGQLGRSFNGMIEQIGKAQEAAQSALREATVKAAVVENSPVNIIVADKEFNITYINPQSLKTFKEIASVLPCRPEEIVGKNIDFFHKNPGHQRRIVADPRNLP
ncbi:MAG: DUF3365 domain-containing protein, partial [Candidatus Latescibacteria bacterium]|nr:DUF3365 domain-containing protein [Candidatus Latescibacterota bacterium]